MPLPTPEIRGSNPAISKLCLLSIILTLYWKEKNKEKEARNGPFLKNAYVYSTFAAKGYIQVIQTIVMFSSQNYLRVDRRR